MTCPVGMDYYEETGSCYRIVEGGKFDASIEQCADLAPGVHMADIHSQVENDICIRYLNQTGENTNKILKEKVIPTYCISYGYGLINNNIDDLNNKVR